MTRSIICLVIVVLILGVALLGTSLQSRIGDNAKSAAFALKTLIEAQEVYHKKDYEGDGRLEYSVTLAELARVGLLPKEFAAADCDKPDCKPYKGYVFRILTAQGDQAPGGTKDWTVNGELMHAHGGVAFPYKYNETGKEHFVITSSGMIFQSDFGAAKTQARDVLIFNSPWIPRGED